MTVHRRLEERLADFKGSPACVLFGSGYLANSGIVAALARAGEVVFSDELNHASIIDGCRLARAEVFVYGHCDVEHLAWGLEQAGGRRGALIVTDGVFSMDGDVAPLAEIVELARRHGVRVMVDEAHGTGALGPGAARRGGRGGLDGEVDVVVGTLGKALGSYGAYACCDATMAKYLVNTARSLIFSTALPPPAVAGALAALDLLEEQPRRVEKLQANAGVLRDELGAAGLDPGDSTTQIVPFVVGDAARAMEVCEAAIERGVFAQAIRPPTVPDGTSRLRLAVMASHTQAELRAAARVLGEVGRRGPPHRRPRPSRPRVSRSDPTPRRPSRSSARPDAPRCAAASSPGTDTGAGKTVVAAAIAAALVARGERRRRVQAGRDGDRRAARPRLAPDHELLAAASAGVTPEAVAPCLRGGGVPPPRRRAGGPADRARRAGGRGARGRRARRRARRRGRRRPARAAHARLPRARPRGRPRAAGRDRRAARASARSTTRS